MRITVESTSVVDLPGFGPTGPYLKVSGSFEGEVDPFEPRNALIADIDLASRENGSVRYRSTFYLLRPLDPARGNGKVFYDFGNRGNKRILQWFNDGTPSNDPTDADHFGHGFLMREGYAIAWSGWDGSAPAGPNMLTIDLPTAMNRDGTSITGPVVAEAIPANAEATAISLPYPNAGRSPSNGVLTVREHQADERIPLGGWTYETDRRIRFPGPARIQWIYEFVYEAKDPKVMGIGHAATRDFVSFLRNASPDSLDRLKLAGGVRAVYSWGRSQGGRVQRDFVYWGFNEDLQGRRVFDGMMAYATGAAGRMWLNVRFSQPTVSAQQHSRHHSPEPEFPHTFPVVTDPLSGQTDGLLRRCLAGSTCPLFINVDGANEYWNKTASLNHTDAFGNDLNVEALAPNVRVYSIASIQHNTTFDAKPQMLTQCQQLTNPIYNGPIFRALAVALDGWSTRGLAPPPSRVPRRTDSTLVPPEGLRFPSIPATAYEGWPELPAVEFNPGAMNHNAVLDFSLVPPRHVGNREYTVLVPQVDEDGNEIAGIRLPDLAAPLGTYTGWALLEAGRGGPDICGQNGQFVPFANSVAERLAAGDPRPSLEERYPDPADYIGRIAAASEQLVQDGFLLAEDRDRIVAAAAERAVGLAAVRASAR